MNINIEFLCSPNIDNEIFLSKKIKGVNSIEIKEDLFSRKKYESSFQDIINIAGVIVNISLLIVSIKQLMANKDPVVDKIRIKIGNINININSETVDEDIKKLEELEELEEHKL